MKIVQARFSRETFPLTRPYSIAFRTTDSVSNFIVYLEDDEGLLGVGAAAPEPHVTGETDEICEQALKEMCLPSSFEDFTEKRRELLRFENAPAARAAVDMALWDLQAKMTNVPLVRLLGCKHRSLPTSITIGIKSLNETLVEADEYLGRGFRVIKLKLGSGLEEDVERTLKLSEHLNGRASLRVDLNQALTLEDYRKYLSKVSSVELEFCEQPVPASQWKELQSLGEEERAKTCVDESLLSAKDAKALISPVPAGGVFNIKLMKCGGITGAQEILTAVENSPVSIMWGCMDESCISIAAALHVAFSSTKTRFLDLDGHLDLARDVASGGFKIEDGEMFLTPQAGLGVTLLSDK